MTDQEFAEMVGRLEIEAQQSPGRYRARVVALIALGYGYVLGMLGLVLLGALGVLVIGVAAHLGWIAFKLAAPIGALGFLIAQSVWVTVPPPSGRTLDPERSRRLFAMIEELRERLEAPRLAAVIANGDFNASISSVPSAGLLGPSRHYLVVGLPLMQALTVEQFRAVLAHEFGHLSHSHGRLGATVWSLRQTWTELLDQLESSRRWGRGLFTRFLAWYAPHFNATTFVLARRQEVEADDCAARATSAGSVASALARINVAEAMLMESFWPDLFLDARREDLPTKNVYSRVGAALTRPIPPALGEWWLDQARARVPQVSDTHPSLTQRLEALGAPAIGVPEGPRSPEDSGVALLGSEAGAVLDVLGRIWQSRIFKDWTSIHEESKQRRARLAALEARAAAGPLSPPERLEAALQGLWLEGPATARPLLEALVAEQPDLAPAVFWLGALRLDDDDERGLALLDRAMVLDPDAVGPACDRALAFLDRHGRKSETRGYRERADEWNRTREAAAEERRRLAPGEAFDPHGLDEESLAAMRSTLVARWEVSAAYLVRRRMKLLPEEPQLLLAILPRTRVLAASQKRVLVDLDAWVRAQVRTPLPTLLHFLSGADRELERALAAVPGARLK